MRPAEIYVDDNGKDVPVYEWNFADFPYTGRCDKCAAELPHESVDFDPESEKFYCGGCYEQFLFDQMTPEEREEMGW